VSGGELSRLMLAIKTVTAQNGRGATLIFDEVDAGIGGHTADVVGRRLQSLGRAYQVLCITHLPQIAAHGDVHFLITKAVRSGRTTTSVARLGTDDRRLEIARMIAGQKPSEGVIASAYEMLSSRTRTAVSRRARGVGAEISGADGAKGETKSKGESERRRAKGHA